MLLNLSADSHAIAELGRDGQQATQSAESDLQSILAGTLATFQVLDDFNSDIKPHDLDTGRKLQVPCHKQIANEIGNQQAESWVSSTEATLQVCGVCYKVASLISTTVTKVFLPIN